MTNLALRRAIAFEGSRAIGEGSLPDVALLAKVVADRGQALPLLVFDSVNSHVIDLDLRGTADDVLRRLSAAVQAGVDGGGELDPATGAASPVPLRRGPGRPRLGVVAREITLLPRHWKWLASQPGGASVALRKLVDAARRTYEVSDRIREAKESAWRFMRVMAASEASLEEASRALFAGDAVAFAARIADWPNDVASHTRRLAAEAFVAPASPAAVPAVATLVTESPRFC